MADKFDPYHKWFGIPPEEQPPDCYRLLGISRFETDLDVISNAADQRMNHLRTLQNGPHALESQKILNHVSKARVTLLDSERKLVYDVALRKKIAAAAAIPAAAGVGVSNSLVSESLSESGSQQFGSAISADAFDDVAVQPASQRSSSAARPVIPAAARTRSKKSPLYKLLSIGVGGVLGLVIGYLLLGNLVGFDPLGLFPAKVILGEDGNGGTPAVASVAPTDDDRREDPQSGSDNIQPTPGDDRETGENDSANASPGVTKKPPVSKTPGTKNPSTPSIVDHPKSPTPAPAPVADPLADIPRQVALPAPNELTAHELISFAVPSPVLKELSLMTTAAVLEEPLKFELAAEQQAQPSRWRVKLLTSADSADAAPVLAELWLDGDMLKFQWQAAAAAETAAAQLQNCLLQLKAGDKTATVALRISRTQSAHVLDMSIAANLIDLNIDAPPKAEVVMLEIGPRDLLPTIAEFRDERARVPFVTGAKEKIVLTLGEINSGERPELPIQPQALRTGFHLRLAPQILKSKGSYSLSLPAVADIKKKYSVQKIKVDSRWSTARDRHAALQKQSADINKVLTVTPAQRIKLDRERTRVAALLRIVEAEFKEATEAKTEVDGVLDSLPAVEELIAELHKKAKIPYRVFAQVGDFEVDLVQATQ